MANMTDRKIWLCTLCAADLDGGIDTVLSADVTEQHRQTSLAALRGRGQWDARFDLDTQEGIEYPSHARRNNTYCDCCENQITQGSPIYPFTLASTAVHAENDALIDAAPIKVRPAKKAPARSGVVQVHVVADGNLSAAEIEELITMALRGMPGVVVTDVVADRELRRGH